MNEIYLYDEIGPDWMGMVSAPFVLNELAKYKDQPVTVRINSPGGSVTEGQAIYNALLRHSGEVTIEVDSLAASMGSYIAMAGKVINMAENAMLMIHNPWSVAIGDAEEMRKQAAVLDKFQGGLSSIYAARSKQTVEKVAEMMADETWLTAAEAVELGFADAVSQPLNVAACVKPGRFAKMPDTFPTVETINREKARHAREAVSRNQLQLARARAGV